MSAFLPKAKSGVAIRILKAPKHSFFKEERIATPVGALARNDMFWGLSTQYSFPCRGTHAPPPVGDGVRLASPERGGGCAACGSAGGVADTQERGLFAGLCASYNPSVAAVKRRRQLPLQGSPRPSTPQGTASALRCPENTSGLRYSSCFPTAAEIAGSLLPPQAAGTCNSSTSRSKNKKTRLTEGVFGDTIPANKGFDGEQRRFSAQRGQAIGCKPPRRKRQADRSRAGRRQCRPG